MDKHETLLFGGPPSNNSDISTMLSSQLHQSNLSDTSSDDPQDPSKFDHVKLTFQQLQRELHAERVKNQAQETLVSRLKETKEENSALRKEVQNKNSAVAVLQNRLAYVGERTDVSLLEGEVVIPGPSRQMLDALSEENIKLKQSLKFMSVDPSHVEELQKAKQTLEKHVNILKQRTQDYQKDNNQLKSTLMSSENVKDKEILRLKQRIQDLEQNKDSQNVLCQSLSDETESLRGKLREMASQCQNLERKLSVISTTTDMSQKPVIKQQLESEHYQMGSSSMLTPQDPGLLACRDENIQIQLSKKEKELKEVVEMNSRWQKYNEQREEYVQKLHKTLTETEEKMTKMTHQTNEGGISEDQQAEIDQIILQCKRKVEIIEEEKQKIEDENRKHLLKVHELEGQLKQKDNDIVTLREHVQVLSNDNSGPQNSISDKERIQILEHQIKICTDDFQQERKDREQAMSRIAALENELEFHKRQHQHLQTTRMEEIAERRRQALNHYQDQYYQQHPNHMVARGVPLYEVDGSGDEGEDTVDGGQSRHQRNYNRATSENGLMYGAGNPQLNIKKTDGPQPTLSVYSKPQTVPENMFSEVNRPQFEVEDLDIDSDSPPKQGDTLQCPKCHLSFPSNKHFDLLDHINDCC